MDEYVGDIRQRVLERMDLSREMSDEEIENLIGEEASRLMQEEPISIRERLMLEARVFNSLRKLDALQELLDDPEISEIMVNGPKHIFYEKAGRVHAWNQAFASEEKMQDVIQQIVGRHNRVVNLSNPIVDTRLADGSRVSGWFYNHNPEISGEAAGYADPYSKRGTSGRCSRVFKDAGKGKIQPVDFGRDKLRENDIFKCFITVHSGG